MKLSRYVHALILAAGLTTIASGYALELETPNAGWTYSGMNKDVHPNKYAYPYSPIARGEEQGRTMIRGKLAQVGRQRHAQIVINGNPMPLYTDQEGRFTRPYAFGRGSNNLEVRSGDKRHKLQFYEANPDKAQARLRIIMAWDEPQAELDLHVLTPTGGHAFFANPKLENGGGFDFDSVDGAGPEMFSDISPPRGLYHVYLNYWGNLGSSGYHFGEIQGRPPVITARITLVFNENTVHEKRQSYVVPVRRIGDLARVMSFVL